MFEKFANSWQLVKASAAVLKADKELVLLPAISGLALVLVSLSFVVPTFMFGGSFSLENADLAIYLGLFAFYFVQYAVIFFFNAALVGAALIRLEGGDPTVGDGLRIAWNRIGAILGYAAIASTVGLVLQAVKERSNTLGSIITSLVGVAWSVMTFLVVPVLVTRDVGPIGAIQESARILKKTWGEQIVGNSGVGLAFTMFHILWTILMVPCFFFAAGSGIGVAVPIVVVVAVLGYLTLALLGATLSGIYSAALYRFAVSGESTVFDEGRLQHAFAAKS